MDKRFQSRGLYDIYRCTIAFRDRLCGGVPRNKELIKAWVTAGTEHNDEMSEAQTQEAKDAIINDVAEKSWIGFFEDAEKGLWMHTRNVKSAFKQGASMLRITTTKIGSKQIFAEGSEIKGLDGSDRIYLDRKTPDGTDEKPIHVMTAQGPRTALKRFDYVTKAKISFELWVLKTAVAEKRHVGEEELIRVLTFLQENGIGADRSQGEGKFDVIEFAPA